MADLWNSEWFNVYFLDPGPSQPLLTRLEAIRAYNDPLKTKGLMVTFARELAVAVVNGDSETGAKYASLPLTDTEASEMEYVRCWDLARSRRDSKLIQLQNLRLALAGVEGRGGDPTRAAEIRVELETLENTPIVESGIVVG